MAILKSTLVNGDLTVTGSLNVQGDLTYVGVNNLRVKDKQIELNTDGEGSAIVSGQGADQAGIVFKGTTKDNSAEASILYNYADDTLVINKTIKGTVASANNAASADKVANKLTVNVTDETGSVKTVEFDGSEVKTVDVNLKGLQDQINSLTGGAGSIATQISNAIKELDVTDAAVDGQYVSSVSETDGKISVTRVALPDYTEVYDAKGDAAQALVDAKAYVDGKVDGKFDAAGTAAGLNAAMDTRVKALEGDRHTHTNKEELDQIATGDVAKWNRKQDALNTNQLNAVNSGITKAKVDNYEAHVANTDIHVSTADKDKWNAAEDNAKAYADGLASNYDAAGAAATAETNAKGYTDAEIKKLGSAAKKNVLEGAIADSTSEDLVTAAQVKAYAAGVVGAMHFRGAVGSTTEITNPASGDICLVGTKEYVYNGTEWVLFGDESAYDINGAAAQALKDAKSYADGLNTAMDTRVDALEDDSHTHANKTELDKIAVGDKKKWDDHVANANIHVTADQKNTWNAKQDALANANILAAITSTQVSNWDDAASKAHEHANKAVLDGITEAKVSAWDGAANAAVVNSVGGKSGALTLKGGSAVLGDVNLSISNDGKISAAIVPDSFDVKGAAAKALTDANAYTDGKVNGKFDATGSAATAEQNAKTYADEKVSALSSSVATTDAAQDTEITNIKNDIANIKNGTTLDGRYVNVSGDTMTGDLTMPSNGTNGIIFGNMKIVWKDNAIEFIPTTA